MSTEKPQEPIIHGEPGVFGESMPAVSSPEPEAEKAAPAPTKPAPKSAGRSASNEGGE